MRIHPLIALGLAAAGIAACDGTTRPFTASLSNIAFINAFGSFVTVPSFARLRVGENIQLTTNAPDSITRDTLRQPIIWGSLQPTIATVTSTGLVTALAVGTATITARFSFDTNRVAPATIVVFFP